MSDFNTKIPLKYHSASTLSKQHLQPHSDQFNDIYFNTEDGLAESNYVFIQGNDLLQRWHSETNKTNFVIAETGFGTGLNFLATLHAWHNTKEKPQHLHFISFEKYPLTTNDLITAHQAFPDLAQHSELLINHWQRFSDQFRHGYHHLKISNNVTLVLGFGDAAQLLTQLNAQVEAWYLDGFAPKKNPEMWQESLFNEINRLSHQTTTVATFTAASQIKKHLLNNGFVVNKLPGFGRKREMISAVFKESKTKNTTEKPWCPTPAKTNKNKKITILGAGIAGLTVAKRFKDMGYYTTIIEKNILPMKEASGNALAMVMPMLTAENSPEMQFYIRAFEAAKDFYTSDEFKTIGVNQHLTNSKQQQWGRAISALDIPDYLVNPYDSKNQSVLYPKSGYVDTQKVADRLSSSVDQWHQTEITSIAQADNGCWILKQHDSENLIEAETLVITNGIQAQSLFPNSDLSITARHGMTTTIQISDGGFNCIELSDGYIIPDNRNNRYICGATFDHLPRSKWYQPAELHDDHWHRNSQLWLNHGFYEHLESAKVIAAHAAIRATTPDHLPICGPMIDQNQFKIDYQDLHHGRHWQQYPTAATYDNLYILNGLGSRGFTSAPLLALYLCAMINGEPLPLENDLCKIIHPNRFLYRSCKKPPKPH